MTDYPAEVRASQLSNSEYVRSRAGGRDLITRSRRTPVDWLIVLTVM